MTTSNSAQPTTENLHDDLILERLDDGQILVYTVKSSKRVVADIWTESIKEQILNVPTGKPFVALYDVSPIMAITPYARAKLEELSDYTHTAEQYADKYGYLVFVLSNSIMNTIVRHFINFDLSRKHKGKYERKIFQDKNKGLAWLREQMANSTKS